MSKLIYSRRDLLGKLGGGIAGLAFADMLGQQGLLASTESPLAAKASPESAGARDFSVQTVSLMESILSPQGAHYRRRATIALA